MNENIRTMIDTQLVMRGIRDPRVLAAMARVPRDRFVPPEYREEAYGDTPLPIGKAQTISQPFMVALMTELLELGGTEKVLEIGTGSGYQTAVLAELSRRVFTIERIPELSERARRTLLSLGYHNISYLTGDGTEGWPEHAPYDRVLVTAASDRVPPPLFEQLAEKGKMIIPLGETYAQELTEIRKVNGEMETRDLGGCVFVPLVGKYGMSRV